MSKPWIVACIPAYNEESSIGSVIVRAMKHVDKVVVCDDGSRDVTGEIARGLGAFVVRHEQNIGKGAALRTAFHIAKDLKPEVVVMLDGDGQHDPGEIQALIKPILEGEADMVVGSRYVKGSRIEAPYYRRLGLRLINALSRKRGNLGIVDTQSGFRAFSAKALEVMLASEVEGYGVDTEQLILAQDNRLRVVEVPVTIKYSGLRNTSKKHPLSHGTELLGTILRMIVEERPLLTLGLPGFFFILTGIFMGIYFLWYFNTTTYFSLPMAFLTFSALFMGTLLIISSLILYAMIRLKVRQKDI